MANYLFNDRNIDKKIQTNISTIQYRTPRKTIDCVEYSYFFVRNQLKRHSFQRFNFSIISSDFLQTILENKHGT